MFLLVERRRCEKVSVSRAAKKEKKCIISSSSHASPRESLKEQTTKNNVQLPLTLTQSQGEKEQQQKKSVQRGGDGERGRPTIDGHGSQSQRRRRRSTQTKPHWSSCLREQASRARPAGAGRSLLQKLAWLARTDVRAREKRERGAPAMIFSLAFPFSKKNEKKRRRRCSLNTKTSAAIQQRVCALVRAVQPRFPKPATSETWTLSTAWLPLRQKRGECSFERELLLDWLMKNSSASGQCWRRCALTSLLNLFSFSFLLPRANNTTTPPTTNAASPASPSSSRQTRPAGSRCLQR